MYIPSAFEITDRMQALDFVSANAFAQLISTVEGRLFSTHVPFILSEDKRFLLGHLALQNPQYNDIDGQEVLVSFEGEHGYISPSWYIDSGVPTWNYQAAHIYGQCKTFRNPERLEHLLCTLSNKYEADFEQPWQVDVNPRLLNAIVGVEIEISDIQCKYKLSQNRSKEDRFAVIKQLKNQGALGLAEVMEKNET